MSSPDFFGNCALLIAHPGHEIRVYGWLEKVRPTVYVLTDGSGRRSCSRLESTKRLLTRAGATPGTVFGRIADRSLYDAVLRHDIGFFRDLVADLCQEIVQNQFDFVLGDAADGTILAHDLWRGVIDAAADAAQSQLNRQILNYRFRVEGPPGLGNSCHAGNLLQLQLDDAAFARKLEAARSYPELRAEVESTLAAYGENAFRVEYLRRTSGQPELRGHPLPSYERHGERLVAAGIYPETVRYEQHVLPILRALRTPRRAA